MNPQTSTDRDTDKGTVVDGRSARRIRNVDAVLDAVVSLAHDGHFDPTAEEIAARAGVSHRSIYRYFEGRSELLEAAAARVLEQISPTLFFSPLGVGTFEERVDQFVGARTTTYRDVGPIARTVFRHIDDPVVKAGIDDMRAVLRDQLAEQFAPEFDAFDESRRREVITLVDAMFQFESLEYLTGSADLGTDALVDALTLHLRTYLRPHN